MVDDGKTLKLQIDMDGVIEPFAVQIKLIDKEKSKEAYTAFNVTPLKDEKFCLENSNSCLCTGEPCRADITKFCRDDRYSFLKIDKEALLIHHLF